MSYVGITKILDKPEFFVPPPHEVVQASFLTWDNLSEMLQALWLTTRVAMTGLGLAIVVGVGLATVMSQAKWIERALYPYAVALQAIPILAFVPLIGLLFGYNFGSRVFVCFLIALFPIIANTLFGLLSADRAQHELFTLHGASRVTRLRKLMYPAALPAMFAGFRISAGLAVIGAIVGDFFFRQGEKGIGILIDQYNQRLNYPLMYGAVILAAALGIVVFWIFGFLATRAVGHWYEESGKPA
jgi:NitT/TauT family transport system permease protein